MKKMFNICIFLFLCTLIPGCSKVDTVSKNVVIIEDTPESYSLTLTMVGDALIHSQVYEDAKEDGNYDFEKMFSLFKARTTKSDLMYYNAETIIGGNELGLSGYPRFNTPKEFGTSMIGMGFNIVSLANNHTLDKGEAGILNSCKFWNEYPHVLTSGSSCTKENSLPTIMSMNNITYSLLSYTTSTNGLQSPNDYYVSIYNEAKVKEDIEYLKDKVDIIIVAMHWGTEYQNYSNDSQKQIATYLASLGVDIVIGTHPHVVQPLEWIEDTLVIYSLGNFISAQNSSEECERLIGLMVNIDIIKTVIDGESSIKLSNLNTELLYTYYENYKNFKVVPFGYMNNTYLDNYKYYMNKYNTIVKAYDSTIKVVE